MFKRHPLNTALLLALATPGVQAAEVVLDEVRVTAQAQQPAARGYKARASRSSMKTDTLLRDTPQSVSVVTSQQLRDQSVQSLADAVRYTPGVTFAQGEGNRDAAVIRGSLSTGDFYLDGIRDDVQYFRDIYNIDRVEILKGANGLAFGRGGSGGVINRISKEAGWTPVREITLSAGSYDHKRAALDVGGKLTTDVAGRINLVSEDSGSYRDGVDVRRNGISPTLTWQAGDNTKVVLSAEYFNDLRVADRGIPSQNGKPFRTDRSTFFGNAAQSPTEITVRSLGASVEHQFGNGVLLSNKTRYADYDKYYQNVYASSSVDGANSVQLAQYRDDTQRQNLFNQTDVNFTLRTGRVLHNVVTGIELGRQDSANTRFDEKNLMGRVPANDPFAVASFNLANLTRNSTTVVDVTSLFVQDQLTFSPQWQAVLGLRQDRFETSFTDAKTAANSSRVSDTELSPRAAVIYKPVEAVSVYGSYSKAFVPRAGDQLNGLTAANRRFDPESFVNRELGVKWDAHRDLTVSAALYHLARENVVAVDPNNTASSILVDGQRVQGVELGVNGRLTSRWSVTGGYALADSEITKNLNATIRNGNATAQTPRHTFSLWNRVDLDPRYGVALGVISRSDMFALDDNTVRLPGYVRVDAAGYYTVSPQLKLQLNVENLLNRDYALNAHNNNNILPGSPIAARLTANYRF